MFGKKSKLIEEMQTKLESIIKEKEALNTALEEKENRIIEEVKEKEYLQRIVSDEQLAADKVISVLKEKQQELEKLEKIIIEKQNEHQSEMEKNKKELKDLKEKIVRNENERNMQSYGFYEPIIADKDSEFIKSRLTEERASQKEMIRNEEYYQCTTEWKVNESVVQGKRMIKKVAKNYVTSFNLMCDAIIERVTVANVGKTKDKIVKTYENINNQVAFYSMQFSDLYLKSKLKELDIMYSLALKKEDEKEEKRQRAEIIKEQKRVAKELEKQREKLEKDLAHFLLQLESGDESVKEKIEELQNKISENDYRQENNLAGYVYIIENKSFGEGVYKIGVTRRLDPLERVAELSNASVPFRFQPNCIIFSDNAFKLEKDLHKEFAEFRVNKVNSRKEYFKVSLQDIARIIKEKYGIQADFEYNPSHDEWLVSCQEADVIGIDEEDED